MREKVLQGIAFKELRSIPLCQFGLFPSFRIIRVHPCESVVPNGFFPRRRNVLSGWLLFGELFLLFVRWRLGIGYNEMYYRNWLP